MLLRRPDVLVLDEPLRGVDVTGQAALFELIAGLRRRHGFAVLMVSHDLHLVIRQTDHVLCLNRHVCNRHVCCRGAPESVSRHPDYTRLFGGQAARALAVYPHAHAHDHDHDHGAHGKRGSRWMRTAARSPRTRRPPTASPPAVAPRDGRAGES